MSAFNVCHQAPQPGPKHRIIRPKANEVYCLLCLSDLPWGIWTHWAGNYSQPCFDNRKQCGGCIQGLPRRWKGYICCHLSGQDRPVFLELTPRTDGILKNIQGNRSSLRGLAIRATRGKGPKSRMNLEAIEWFSDMTGHPPGMDPHDVLAKLWNLPKMFRQVNDQDPLPFTGTGS